MAAKAETVVIYYPRCQKCGKILAKFLAVPYSVKCQDCRAHNVK